VTEEAAEAELREILLDEPDWRNVLRVEPIKLDEASGFPELEGLGESLFLRGGFVRGAPPKCA
jgi:hypothetical protein